MELNRKIKLEIIKAYVLLFYLIAAYKFLSNQFLYQIEPPFFFNNLDITTWLVELTNIQHFIIYCKEFRIVFDSIFYLLPILYLFAFRINPKASLIFAFVMLVSNIIYATVFCIFPTASIEGFIAVILMPTLFLTYSLKSFWFVFHALRYYFIYFFFTAGVWKFIQGGVFFDQQMSNILVSQHQELFVASNESSTLLQFYKWLIINPDLSYWLYFMATIVELVFILGFITRRFDKWLILLFLLFLFFDYIIMQINYIVVLPFIITLYYSKYKYPENEPNLKIVNNISTI